jgi:hypothetical protein
MSHLYTFNPCHSSCLHSLPRVRMGSRSLANHGANRPDSECSFKEKSASLPLTSFPSIDPSDNGPTDGGLLAWLQVAGGFFVLMNTWYVYLVRLQMLTQSHTNYSCCPGASSTRLAHTRTSMKSTLFAHTLPPPSPGSVLYRVSSS